MKTMIGGLLLVAGLSVSAASVAEDYTVEGGVSWWNFDGSDAWGTDITTYFSPVTTQGLPLAEAPFLNQVGNLRIDYARNDDDDYDVIEGMLEVYANDYYAAIGASRFSNQFDDLDSFGLQFGRMVTPETRLTLGWERVDTDPSEDMDIFTVGVKHVHMFGGGRAISLESSLGAADNDDTDFVYDLLADYYLMPELSVGARYRGIGSNDQYGLGTRYFFLPNWSGEVEWLRDEDDEGTIQVRMGARF